ncbi:MAG: electron transfer flavoprotein subunit alpha/FixB family protein [Planctomycetota bacterium]|nr:MAG: electron transfer flavoprotein subunit alpha/FixB family protein [Planctomycetota bacterium]
MASKILVVAEFRGGKFKKGALECVAEAARLKNSMGGGEVTALVIGGAAAKQAAASLGKQGADRVLCACADWLEHFNGDAYGRIAVAAAKAEAPSVLFISATLDGKDLAPRIAAALDVGYAPDVTKLVADGEKLTLTRPLYAGKAYATVVLETSPQVVSIRPNAVPLAESEGGDAPVSDFAVDFGPDDLASKVSSVEAAKSEKADLTEAEIIVSGGRGLKGPENFQLLEELADVLGATVGASRAVVDAGWRPHSDQVGQTGKTVSPNLYFAIGISGAIQHLAGMSTSKTIVAINKDPEAPIFKVADYGIVGDLFEVVPRLTEELKKAKAG